jgi:hypothetical protein
VGARRMVNAIGSQIGSVAAWAAEGAAIAQAIANLTAALHPTI